MKDKILLSKVPEYVYKKTGWKPSMSSVQVYRLKGLLPEPKRLTGANYKLKYYDKKDVDSLVYVLKQYHSIKKIIKGGV